MSIGDYVQIAVGQELGNSRDAMADDVVQQLPRQSAEQYRECEPVEGIIRIASQIAGEVAG